MCAALWAAAFPRSSSGAHFSWSRGRAAPRAAAPGRRAAPPGGLLLAVSAGGTSSSAVPAQWSLVVDTRLPPLSIHTRVRPPVTPPELSVIGAEGGCNRWIHATHDTAGTLQTSNESEVPCPPPPSVAGRGAARSPPREQVDSGPAPVSFADAGRPGVLLPPQQPRQLARLRPPQRRRGGPVRDREERQGPAGRSGARQRTVVPSDPRTARALSAVEAPRPSRSRVRAAELRRLGPGPARSRRPA